MSKRLDGLVQEANILKKEISAKKAQLKTLLSTLREEENETST